MVSVVDVQPIDDTLEIVVQFNTTPANPLGNLSATNPAKWSARWDGQRWSGVEIHSLTYQTVRFIFNSAVPQAGANEVAYTNAPSDFTDSQGHLLPASSLSF